MISANVVVIVCCGRYRFNSACFQWPLATGFQKAAGSSARTRGKPNWLGPCAEGSCVASIVLYDARNPEHGEKEGGDESLLVVLLMVATCGAGCGR